ncbi:MAG: SUMF1/EgtB/PvdO family nonheme iron enzyme [Sedimenticola sp.]
MSDPGRGRVQQGHKRVLRGGSWINNGRNLRSANRNGNEPDERNHNIGLRLAGALGIGGSINQRLVPFRRSMIGGRSLGPWCVSRPSAESLPVGRLFFRGSL